MASASAAEEGIRELEVMWGEACNDPGGFSWLDCGCGKVSGTGGVLRRGESLAGGFARVPVLQG